MIVNWSLLIMEASNRTGYKVTTLARKLNLSNQQMQRLANGETDNPSWKAAIKLLDYYYDNVDTDLTRIKINH